MLFISAFALKCMLLCASKDVKEIDGKCTCAYEGGYVVPDMKDKIKLINKAIEPWQERKGRGK
jgi:hypothetical protein